MSSADSTLPPCEGDSCSASSELTVALIIVGLALFGVCCYIRARRAAIFGKTNVKGGKNYQPLSRSDFDSMVQGVFDDSDEDSLDGDLEMGNTDFNSRSGVTAVKTKLDFDGDFVDSDEEDYKV
ncbi:hypothetical protein TrVE_jg12880 [Triparma verrucosa]|uniref:Uncharacterized protein n=1 Tax=Triparma verrucosa TaxID=1606542 RepID=A0A9W7FEN1_9STRA|nr:hypothetical protein TrVE_jg12880 [Triparma verrucosa]